MARAGEQFEYYVDVLDQRRSTGNGVRTETAWFAQSNQARRFFGVLKRAGLRVQWGREVEVKPREAANGEAF